MKYMPVGKQGSVLYALLGLCMIVPGTVSGQWTARHGLSNAAYQSTFDDLVGQGYRLVHISGYGVDGSDRYAAIWEMRAGPGWQAVHGVSSDQYQAVFDDLTEQEYRLVDVSGYNVNGQALYAGIWEQRSGPLWVARHRLSSSAYQEAFDDYASQGFRLIDISGYEQNGEAYYAAIWDQSEGPDWEARHGLTTAEFQVESDDLVARGYRLINRSAYTVDGQVLHAGIWENGPGPAWQARSGLTSAEYQDAFDDLVSDGYRLDVVSGYGLGAQDYYAAIWSMPEPIIREDLPVSGYAGTGLAAFDEVMQTYMKARNIRAGALAIMIDGVLLYEKGFGWLDPEMTLELPSDALFRLASVSKPITAAAIKKLIAAGKLRPGDQVFCLTETTGCILNIAPSGTADSRVEQITIQHLLDHRGGWDRDLSGDPMFNAIGIASAMGIPSPPGQEQIVQYMLGRPLDFSPGSKYAYSNFGYLVLGLVVEAVEGRDYTRYVQEEIFLPEGVPSTEIELGRSEVQHRNPREPWYADPFTGYNVFAPEEQVPFPDGGFHVEAFEAHGGLIASAPALTHFLNAYWISGDPRIGNGSTYEFNGSMPGTYTYVIQRPNGANMAALFNQRADESGLGYSTIRNRLIDVSDGISAWPVSNAPDVERGLPDGARQLQGNYPNPFSSETEIEFTLAAPRAVSVTIYNLLGQEVGRIAEGWYAEGRHRIRWRPGALPSGVYVYRMFTKDGYESGQMLVLRTALN